MAKITLVALSETRDKYDAVVNELKYKYRDNIIYQEKMEGGGYRRPIFLLKNQAELDDVKSTIAQLQALTNEIRDQAGYSVRLPQPALELSVLFYRIWEHEINASATMSRDDIIGKIKRRLITAERNLNATNHLAIEQLRNELSFFMAEKEELYRARSVGSPVTYIGLSKTNGIDARIKSNDAGTFIVGANFVIPHGETPKNQKQRKKRVSIFDGIEPVPYSGAVNALLYRESEVIARKKVVGFSADKQKAAKDANKSKKTRRDKA